MSEKEANKKNSFYCAKCNYSTFNKYDFNKHKETKKHKNKKKIIKAEDKLFICSFCSKDYKYKSGLSRHMKKCIIKKSVNEQSLTEPLDKDTKIVNDLLIMIKEQEKRNSKVLESLKGGNFKIFSKILNGDKMPIMYFLNEKCKDALNLKEFLNDLEITLDDLEHTTRYGYVSGISNILIKQLSLLDEIERPIHCSDKKRLKFYMKCENEWIKGDDSNKMLDKMIHEVKIKQIKQLKEWEDLYPDFMNNTRLLDKWQCMVDKILGENGNKIKNNNRIKKRVSEIVPIKDALKIKNID